MTLMSWLCRLKGTGKLEASRLFGFVDCVSQVFCEVLRKLAYFEFFGATHRVWFLGSLVEYAFLMSVKLWLLRMSMVFEL